MKFRLLVGCALAGFLGGCTNADWDHALSYVGVGDQPAAAAQPAPAAPSIIGRADAPEAWCKEAAGYERDDAARDGFDAATQQHLFDTRYAQCMSSASQR